MRAHTLWKPSRYPFPQSVHCRAASLFVRQAHFRFLDLSLPALGRERDEGSTSQDRLTQLPDFGGQPLSPAISARSAIALGCRGWVIHQLVLKHSEARNPVARQVRPIHCPKRSGGRWKHSALEHPCRRIGAGVQDECDLTSCLERPALRFQAHGGPFRFQALRLDRRWRRAVSGLTVQGHGHSAAIKSGVTGVTSRSVTA